MRYTLWKLDRKYAKLLDKCCVFRRAIDLSARLSVAIRLTLIRRVRTQGYMVARMQKMKAGNLGGAYKHNERVFETHSNKDIDPSRSHLNYELTDRDHSVSYEKQIKDYVNENKNI